MLSNEQILQLLFNSLKLTAVVVALFYTGGLLILWRQVSSMYAQIQTPAGLFLTSLLAFNTVIGLGLFITGILMALF
jgi:hypothetical protein